MEGNKCNKISIKDKIKCDNNNDNNLNGNNTNNKNPIVVNCLDILKNNENPNDIIACSVMGDLNNSILLLKQDK